MSTDWRPLGAVAPAELRDARMQAHYASQIVSGVARTLLDKRDDDSHTNLAWNRRLGALDSNRLAFDQLVRFVE